MFFLYVLSLKLVRLWYKTRNLLEARNAPQMPVVYKGRICNPTLLVHQDMTKKITFYERN